MGDKGLHFNKPFNFGKAPTPPAEPKVFSEKKPQMIPEEPFEHPPTLVVASTKPPKPAKAMKPTEQRKQPVEAGFSNLKPRDLAEVEKFEQLAYMDLEDILEDKHIGASEQPAQFIERGEDENRQMAVKMQSLVDKLSEYKDKLAELRDKNLELSKTSYERSKDIEQLSYEKSMLLEALKNYEPESPSKAQQYVITKKRNFGQEEERRRNEMRRELINGAGSLEGGSIDLVGKEGRKANKCDKCLQKLFNLTRVVILLKNNLKTISARYDKSISSYFSFFKFLVNASNFIALIFAYVLVIHLLNTEDYSNICSSGVPCWALYSSFTASEAFEFSLSIMGLILFTVAAGFIKWVRIDLLKRQSEVYGGSDAKIKKFSVTVINNWDWNIDTQPDSNDQSVNVSQLISIELKDKARLEEASKRTKKQKAAIRTRRIFGSVVYLIFLVIGWILITLLVVSEADIIEFFESSNSLLNLFISFIPKLGVSFVNAFFPAATIKLTALENWDTPAFIVKIQIFRMYMAKILNVILFAVLNLELAVNGSWFSGSSIIEYNDDDYTCREDQAGVNLLLLVFSEAIVSKLVPLIMASIFKGIAACKNVVNWKKEIKVAQQVINIIYFQSLVWITIPFFPFMAFISPILFFLDFKFQYWRLRNLQVKPQQQTQASDIVVFIIRIYCLTMSAAIAFLAYFLLYEHSNSCGMYNNDTQAKDPVVKEIEDLAILGFLWKNIFDYAQFFWIIAILLITKIAFTGNSVRVTKRYIKDKEVDFDVQVKDMSNVISKMQKQLEITKRMFRQQP